MIAVQVTCADPIHPPPRAFSVSFPRDFCRNWTKGQYRAAVGAATLAFMATLSGYSRAETPVPPSQLRVALVDDDESVCVATGRLLRVVGYEVEMYRSGQEFLAAIGERPPDCVVLDVHMPVLGGLAVQAALAARSRQLPVVFITAHEDADERRRALAAGATAYLYKPFSQEKLLDAIASAIAGSAATPSPK